MAEAKEVLTSIGTPIKPFYETHEMAAGTREKQIQRLAEVKRRRSGVEVARSQEELGLTAAAAELLERIVETEPSFRDARERLLRLRKDSF